MIKGCGMLGFAYGILQIILCIDYLIGLTIIDMITVGLGLAVVYSVTGMIIGSILELIKKLI